MKAWTKYPNTKESDLQDLVPHIVESTDDKGQTRTVEVMARDPLNAIVLVTALAIEHVMKE
jgi:hypothetical protein